MKVVIIGNGGSGKTWLAKQLASRFSSRLVHLDNVFWEPGGFDKKRKADDVSFLVQQTKSADSWIVEGVFGELAERYLDEAAALIWLNLDWETCKRRLEMRGSESKAHMSRIQSEAGLVKLIEWASEYWVRGDSRSFHGHERIFENFNGFRVKLRSEEEVTRFVNSVQQVIPADAAQASRR